MTKPKKRSAPREIPPFESEDAERRFWAEHDPLAFFDWGKAVKGVFPNLKPTTASISIRLPVTMLEDLKSLANEKDVPYQSLMKVYLADRLAFEQRRRVPGARRGAAAKAR